MPYRRRQEIKVFVDGVERPYGSFSFLSDSIIRLPDGDGELVGKVVTVRRQTGVGTAAAVFQRGGLDHKDLNNNATQGIFAAQEFSDRIELVDRDSQAAVAAERAERVTGDNSLLAALLAAVASLATPALSDFAYAPPWASSSPTTVKERLDGITIDLESVYGVNPSRSASQNTARLQAALDDHAGTGRTLLLPRGVVKHLGINVTPPLRLVGHGAACSMLFLENAANRSAIEVAYVPRGVNYEVKQFDVEDLTVHGNRTMQSTGWLVDFLDGGGVVTGASYGWSMRSKNAVFVSGKSGGIIFRDNRNGAVLGPGTLIQYCDGDGVRILSAGDMRFLTAEIDGCLGCGINDVGGFAIILDNCNIYSNLIGVRKQPYAADITIYGGSIDYHQQAGVSFEGGQPRNQRIVYGTNFGLNSQAGLGLYPDIFCLDNSSGQFVGTAHNHRGTGHKPKYLIEFSGTCGLHQFTPQYDTTDIPWVTALTNSFDKLVAGGNVDCHVGPRGGFGTVYIGQRGIDILRLFSNSGGILDASAQYSGFRVQTPSGVPVGDLIGFDALNRGGVLRLFGTGGTLEQVIAAPSSGALTQLILPGPYADDAAAGAAGVLIDRCYRRPDGSVVARLS